MSINILTADGLVKLSGDKVTKDSIISALGYVPADEEILPNIIEDDSGELCITDESGNVVLKVNAGGLSTTEVSVNGILLGDTVAGHAAVIEELTDVTRQHTSDTDIHITSEERELWNDKDYNNLENKPNITENDSDSLQITDNNGNIIMQVDANGLETTNVKAQNAVIAGQDVGEHLADTIIHITAEEHTLWETNSHSHDNKELLDNYTGSYNDLTDRPIVDDEDGSNNLQVVDDKGYIIMQVDAEGLETTGVKAQTVAVAGQDVGEHLADTDIHITPEERTLWNDNTHNHDNKELLDAYTGSYNDLVDRPIVDDGSEIFSITDDNDYVIMRVSADGLETTNVIAQSAIVRGVDVGETLSSHINDDNIHITPEERKAWDAKATTEYVAEQIAALVDSSPETLNTLNELAAALGDDPNFATTVATEIGKKADLAELIAHTSDQSNPHKVTATQIGLGNVNNTSDADKPVSAAQQAALNALKSELSESIESESNEWTIVDSSGNIIARVDANGLTTTNVTATTSIVVGGVNIIDEINSKADSSTTLDGYGITDAYTKTETDTLLSNKAPSIHTHTKSQVGLGNVDNTSDADKPVSAAQQEALDSLKSELSESIVTESEEWTIVDGDGNIVAKVGEFDDETNGLETTKVIAQSAVINGTDVETALNNINSNIANIKDGTTVVKKAEHAGSADEAIHAVSANNATKATQDASGNVITSTYETKTDAIIKLDTAKEYADGLIEALDVSDTAISGQYVTAVSENNGKISVSRTPLPDYSTTYAPYENEYVTETELNNVSAAQQAALNALKSELSESIVSESKEFIVTDDNSNVVLRVGELDENYTGLETTNIRA